MVGPVFALELLRERRRGRYSGLLPWAYAGLLGMQVLMSWVDVVKREPSRLTALRPQVFLLPSGSSGLAAQHFVVLFLLTPALAAPAFSEEKAKGILTDLFTTALTSWDIVLGKLLGRSLRSLQVLLAGLPVLWAVAGHAGLSLAFCAALLLLTLLAVVAVTALALAAAVGSRHASGAVLGTYALLGLGAFAVLWVPVPALDPFRTLTACWGNPENSTAVRSLLEATLAWGLVTATGLGAAVWLLRPVHARQMEGRGGKGLVPVAERPPVGDDPIRWKEYHTEGLAPLPVLRRVPRWVGLGAVLFLSFAGPFLALSTAQRRRGSAYPELFPEFVVQALLFLLIATLIVAVRSATAVTGERERQTWDSLRLTPLDGRDFIEGKLRGIFDAVLPYYCAYAVLPVLFALVAGPACLIVTAGSLVLAWPLMYYAAACGLNASVFARSTWRSLVMALFSVYATGLMTCVVVSVASTVVLGTLAFLLCNAVYSDALDKLLFVFVSFACVLALVILARSQLRQAAGRAFEKPRSLSVRANTHAEPLLPRS